MPRVRVSPQAFGPALRRRLNEHRRQIEGLALNAAHRGQAYAVNLVDEEGLVDIGEYKRAFSVRRIPRGAELRNTAPYAGVIEYGRRPNRPGPPFEPIFQWVRRKLGIEDPGVAWAIRNAIHRRGTRPRFILRRTHRRMLEWFRADVRKLLSR